MHGAGFCTWNAGGHRCSPTTKRVLAPGARWSAGPIGRHHLVRSADGLAIVHAGALGDYPVRLREVVSAGRATESGK